MELKNADSDFLSVFSDDFRVIESYLEGKCGLDALRDLTSRAESVSQLAAESFKLEGEVAKSQSTLDNLEELISKCEDQAAQLDNQVKTVTDIIKQ